MTSWKKLDRKTIYDTKFLKLYEDTVELPNGQVFNDYSVVKFPDSVVIVATDENDNLLLFKEYKYAIDEEILSFPAGSIDDGEDPVQAAARELLEETGYESSEIGIVGESHDYPSKVQHTDYFVRAKNAKKKSEVEHEAGESIGDVLLVPVSEINGLWKAGKFKGAYVTAALAHTFPDKLQKLRE